MVQGATQVALTCLDVLAYLDEIKVCVGYEIDGEVTDMFPTTPRLMWAKPVFETLPGWKSDVRGITEYDALLANAKGYVEFLEGRIGVPITIVVYRAQAPRDCHAPVPVTGGAGSNQNAEASAPMGAGAFILF